MLIRSMETTIQHAEKYVQTARISSEQHEKAMTVTINRFGDILEMDQEERRFCDKPAEEFLEVILTDGMRATRMAAMLMGKWFLVPRTSILRICMDTDKGFSEVIKRLTEITDAAVSLSGKLKKEGNENAAFCDIEPELYEMYEEMECCLLYLRMIDTLLS